MWIITPCLGLGHEKWYALYVLLCSYGQFSLKYSKFTPQSFPVRATLTLMMYTPITPIHSLHNRTWDNIGSSLNIKMVLSQHTQYLIRWDVIHWPCGRCGSNSASSFSKLALQIYISCEIGLGFNTIEPKWWKDNFCSGNGWYLQTDILETDYFR